MASNNKSPPKITLEEWKKGSRLSQSNFAYQFSDRIWDEFKIPSAREDLWRKVAYAVAGSPDKTDIKEAYSKCRELIDDITEKCIRYSKKKYSDVYAAFLFVCSWVEDSNGFGYESVVPLIRIRTSDSEDVTSAYYIDHTGRVCDNWTCYLKKNTFDCSWICVPRDGKYTYDDDNFMFYDQTGRGDVLQVCDKVSSVTGITTALTSLVGLGLLIFPPTAAAGAIVLTGSAIAGAPAAAYGTGRSVGTLVSRATHDQSINPFESAEARGSWITAAASVLSVATMGAGKALATSARAGNLVSAEIRVLCTALSVTSLSVNGLGVINGFYELSKKGKDVTPLDVVQLTTSIFFFTHSVVNFQTASGIIKQAQRGALGEIRDPLAPRDQKKFDAMLKGQLEAIEPGKVREMHGNAKFIKQMNKIENKAQFFSDFKLVGGQNLRIHKEVVIHPNAYMQMSETYRNDLVSLSRKLRNGNITPDQFNKDFAPIQREFRLHTERQIVEVQQRVAPLAGRQVGEREIFKNLSRQDQIRLDQVCREAGRDYNQDRMNLGMRLAERQGASNVTEFTAVMEYANRMVDQEVRQLQNQNPDPARPRGMKVKDFYAGQVLDRYRNTANLDALNNDFNSVRARCDPQNNAGTPRFGNSMAAANHYDKHKYLPRVDQNNNLTPERYFEIAREMAGDIGTVKWTQDGASLCCEVTSEIYGAKMIRYDNLADGRTVIATLMEVRGERNVAVAQRVIDN